MDSRFPPVPHADLNLLHAQLDLLPAADRVLLELVPTRERSVREVARLLGVNPGWLSRRYRTLLKRLQDPLVGLALSRKCALPAELRQIAVERFLLGLPTITIAERHRLDSKQVTETLAFIRGYARGIGLLVPAHITRKQPGAPPSSHPATRPSPIASSY